MMFKKMAISAIVLTGLAGMAFMDNFYSNTQPSSFYVSTVESENYGPIVVLELFTSQGCSSCPSADALLDKVKNEFEAYVFPMSYHVDYWNYIGWEDPFSKPRYAEKQRAYNIKFKNSSNYTPQVVVNGREHFVGSSSSKLYGAINSYGKKKTVNKIDIANVKANAKKVSFRYTVLGSRQGKNLRAILLLDQRTTEIKRGENRNRTLTNSNVVVAEKYIGMDEGEGNSFISVPEIVDPDEKISLVLLIENEDYDITGASKSAIIRENGISKTLN